MMKKQGAGITIREGITTHDNGNVQSHDHSGVVYKFQRGLCNDAYSVNVWDTSIQELARIMVYHLPKGKLSVKAAL